MQMVVIRLLEGPRNHHKSNVKVVWKVMPLICSSFY